MLSMQDSLELIQAAQEAGAQGFVTKSESPPFCGEPGMPFFKDRHSLPDA